MEAIPTHIGIYFKREVQGPITYTFCIGREEELGGHDPEGAELVKKIKITTGHLNVLKKIYTTPPPVIGRVRDGEPPHIGSIGYKYVWTTATTAHYFPKPVITKLRGLGYRLEMHCTEDLAKRFLVTHIETPADSSPERTGQLEKVGLPIGKPVEIGRWLEGLKKGVRLSV